MKPSRDFIYISIIALLLALCAQLFYTHQYAPRFTDRAEVFYNRDVRLNEKLIQQIREADKFVYFAVYTFTRYDLKNALLAAKKRGLDVRGLTDKTQLEKIDIQSKIVKELKAADIPVATQDHLGIMHLKVLVTDKAYASGSYNWTASATTTNDEVLEIGHDPEVRAKYEKIMKTLFGLYAR